MLGVLGVTVRCRGHTVVLGSHCGVRVMHTGVLGSLGCWCTLRCGVRLGSWGHREQTYVGCGPAGQAWRSRGSSARPVQPGSTHP